MSLGKEKEQLEDDPELIETELESTEVADDPENPDQDQADQEEEFGIELPIEIDGKEQVLQLSADELRDAVIKSREREKLSAELERLKELSKQSEALTKFVASDPLSSAVVGYKAKGYTDEQIISALAQHIGLKMASPETTTETDSENPDIVQLIESKIAPLKNENEQLKRRQEASVTLDHNNRVLADALQQSGLAYDGTQEQLDSINRAMQELYPGVDITQYKFKLSQAAAILERAGLSKVNKSKTEKISTVQKSKFRAPQIIKGGKPIGKEEKTVKPNNNIVSFSQRAENYDKLFS